MLVKRHHAAHVHAERTRLCGTRNAMPSDQGPTQSSLGLTVIISLLIMSGAFCWCSAEGMLQNTFSAHGLERISL